MKYIEMKKPKNIVKRANQTKSTQEGKDESGLCMGKRKYLSVESEIDGDDVMMREMEIQGKKLEFRMNKFEGIEFLNNSI